MTEQTPATTTSQPAQVGTPSSLTTSGTIAPTVTVTQPSAPTPTPAASGGEKQPPWGKPENFDADKAWELIQNLRNEKGDPTVAAQIDAMRQEQQKQRDALAAALGLKPEETSDADKLAKQIEAMQGQILASERRAISATSGVPESLLTATDADGLRQQAEALVQFAQAAHFAAITAAPSTPPAFQTNPGQGQNGGPLSAEQIADAEYEKYYPSSK